jgi:hypothetical protein
MNHPHLAELESAAAAGNAGAMTQLGIVLLDGNQGALDPQKATHYLEAAAASGDGKACERLATLAGAGICRPPSWEAALEYLRRSAEAGWKPAQDQLRLLATNMSDAIPAPAADASWAALARAVDVRAWLQPPARQSISESPRIRSIPGFVSLKVSNWMIQRAQGKLQRACTYDPVTGAPSIDPTRTNTETDFNIIETDLVQVFLRARIATATGLPPAVMELTKVLHYDPGQYFGRHFDFIDPAESGLAAELAARGQRLVTLLVYLNDDYEGGETEFPSIGLRHRGRSGDALYFANVDPAGIPDRKTLHAGLAPLRGEKWLLSQWIRDRVPQGR